MNGYNFTERVRKSLARARDEAAELRHEYVGTEHILLGLLESEGVAVDVLQNLKVDLPALRDAVLKIAKPGGKHSTGPDLPYTSRGKKVLELSMSEARELHHAYVGTEHLLLGLIREEKGIASEVLAHAGATLDGVRAETLRVLGGPHRPSPVNSMPSVGSARSWQATEPWRILAEPARHIVEHAYGRARAVGRTSPDAADLLAAIIFSSPDVAAAFTSRQVEIDALLADVRRRAEKGGGAA